MKTSKVHDQGFALVLVLWVVAIMSAIAVAFVSNVQMEARAGSVQREALAAEELARAGQEIVPFLASRGLGTNNENLQGLPVEVLTRGLHYRVAFDSGTVDIYFESDNGKINPATAQRELLENFWSLWTNDRNRGATIAASILDWRDADTDPESGGAEAPAYSGQRFSPRNAGLWIADLPWIQGLNATDFEPKVPIQNNQPGQPIELLSALTNGPVGTAINPNFAPEIVLRAVPGLSDSEVQTILDTRQRTFFHSPEEFQAATAINLTERRDTGMYLVFTRGASPSVLAIANVKGTAARASLRHVYFTLSQLNPQTGAMNTATALAIVERNVFPEFVR